MEVPALRALVMNLCTEPLAAVGVEMIQNSTKAITNTRVIF